MDKKECIYPHNGEQQTEQQSKQWTKCADSSPKKSKTILSAGKIITFIFRNSPWIVFINYIKIAGWINIFNRVLKLLKIQTSILTVLGRNNNKWPFWAKQKIVFFRKCSIDSHIYIFFFQNCLAFCGANFTHLSKQTGSACGLQHQFWHTCGT